MIFPSGEKERDMAKIRLLSENMIGKIAAGEVVERPAAAIKELVENSLDAGASAVTVEIREGGLSYIRVSDNGSGIDESDVRLAFERHATSKISKEEQLNAISTLGFRGEALASIAAVSRVTMITRTRDRDTGLKVMNEGGKITEISETVCPVGTTMTIKDLFFNVPVRKGFMKKAAQETAAIHDLMVRMMLSRPDVSFRYIADGRTEYHSPGDGQAITAIQTVYGSKTARTIRSVNDHLNGLIISGYVGVGENARGNRTHELFFINGRVMQSKLLNEAVEAAVRERVMIGRFPMCALYITIAYEAVDVNVHPNKLEVRFRDEKSVYDAVFSAVLLALKDKDAFEHPVQMQLTNPQADTKKEDVQNAAASQAAPARIPKETQPVHVEICSKMPDSAALPLRETKPEPDFQRAVTASAGGIRVAADAAPIKKLSPAPSFEGQTGGNNGIVLQEKAEQINTILASSPRPMRVFGALFNTYILVEYEDQLLLIDQHAVHERLLFDKMMNEYSGKKAPGQELLVPSVIAVTKHEQHLLEENQEALESIGLCVESFGENDVAVRTMPVILGETQAADFLREVISELENGKNPAFEKKRTVLLQAACKHAVKGGESLSEDQLRYLLDTMIEKKVTPTCPHGRPLVVAVTHRELDKKFKRIQS